MADPGRKLPQPDPLRLDLEVSYARVEKGWLRDDGWTTWGLLRAGYRKYPRLLSHIESSIRHFGFADLAGFGVAGWVFAR